MEQMSQYLDFLPEWAVNPVIAVVTVVIGYIIAKIAAALVAGAINRTGIGRQARSTGGNIGKSLSKAVFWVLWLIFILMGLSQFPVLGDQLGFLNGMMDTIFGYLPQLIVGIVVFAVGVMLAKVVRNALTSTLEVVQIDNLANRFGVAGATDHSAASNTIANSLGGLAQAIVVIFAATAAISIWDIPGFSDEVSGMLGTVLNYIPSIFAAAAILAVAVFIAKFVSNLAKSTLPALGFDNSMSSIASLDGDGPSFVPSHIVATIGFVGIVLMGLTAAMNALGIPELTKVFNTLLAVGSRVVLGAIIIGVGIFIANFVSRIVTQTSGELAGRIIKYTTILIITFMGLNTMELGQDIVDSAFKYSVMALAAAAGIGGALSFGLGGRDWAGKKLQEWLPAKTTRRK